MCSRHDIAEILLKLTSETNQSTNQNSEKEILRWVVNITKVNVRNKSINQSKFWKRNITMSSVIRILRWVV
jgi:K+/H+ antiporter YhaU regulatory subunit KhtT